MTADASAGGTTRRKRLARRRKALGLTQESLAELLDVERSTVVRWERGESEPLPWMRPRLATALRVSADQIEELLSNGEPPDPATGGTARWRRCPGSFPRRSPTSPAAPKSWTPCA